MITIACAGFIALALMLAPDSAIGQEWTQAEGVIEPLPPISICMDPATHQLVQEGTPPLRLASSLLPLCSYEGLYVRVEGIIVTPAECSYMQVMRITLLEPPVTPGWSWKVPLQLVSEDFAQTRIFGVNPLATDGFDEGLDEVVAPPGFTHYSYFALEEMPYYLGTEFRGHSNDQANRLITWTLKVVNAGEKTTQITWNAADLPNTGYLTMQAGAQSPVNMREAKSFVLQGDQDVVISCCLVFQVIFEFPRAGWYLVSLPLLPLQITDVAQAFPGALAAYRWNSELSRYEPATILRPGEGYWVAIKEPVKIPLTGTPIFQIQLHLKTGWHLLGSPFTGGAAIPPQTIPAGAILRIFGFDPLEKLYFITARLTEKQGYWVAITEECDWYLGYAGLDDLNGAYPDFRLAPLGRDLDMLPPPPPDWPLAAVETTPESFILEQNHPNPFNPSTTIRYQLPEAAAVEMRIYNLSGRLVRTLVRGDKSAGSHEAIWNSRDDFGQQVTSGIYWAKLNAGQSVKLIKMSLIK